VGVSGLNPIHEMKEMSKTLKVAGLFTGHASWETPFLEGGHRVFTTDYNQDYTDCTFLGNIMDVTAEQIREHLGGDPDIMVMSPPCTTFSIASCSTHWYPPAEDGTRLPRSENAVVGLEIMRKALQLVEELKPKFWIMENPRGLMRKMPDVQNINRKTVWYCQYGDTRAKPTDLWGVWPKSFVTRPECRNANPDCDHQRAPRGSRTGTQGLANNAMRSLIPAELCEDWYNSCVRECEGNE
jgi:hypothetical protein